MTDEAPATHQTGQSSEPTPGRSIGSKVVPDAIRGRLIAKVVVAVFAILLLTAAISTFFYFGISDQLSGQVDDQVEQTTELHTSVLDNWITDRERELEEIEQADVLLSRDSEDISAYLQRETPSTGFSTVHIVDSETGEVIGSSNEAAIGVNMFNYLDEETTSQMSFVSRKQYSSIDGGDEQMVAIGKTHRYHQANLLIVGEVPAETAGPELPQAIEGADTAIVTETGGLVVGSEGDGVGAAVIDPSVEGVGIHEDDDRIYSYSALETADLYVVTTTPRDAAFAVADNVLWSFAATIVLTGAVLTAIGVAGGRSVSKELNRLGQRARTMEDGDLSVDLRTGRIDEIGSLYSSFAAMRDSLRQQIDEAQSARAEAEAERERVQRINDDLETAADEYCTVMEAAADGDLQVRADVETDNDSMRTIGEEFNEMLDTMEATVGELQTFATQVAIASEQVTASSEEVRSASEQISESVQEISVGAERQNESLQEANGEMSDLSTTTEEIAASSNEVADIAERTATAGRTGREAAQEAIDHVTATESEAEQAVEEIRELEAEVGQIDELIDRIQQISEQTNMLALNANIEASRSESGDEADGFGAVAQEIKELSNDAKTAAEQVETRLESIREQTVRSAEEVEATSTQLQSAGEQVERAVEALEEIAEYAEETNVGVQEISAATEEQAATTQEVVAIVDEAATISEETTAEAESVAAATEEQTTALTEVSSSASQLSSQASELSNALDHFETDVDDTSAGIVSVEYDGDVIDGDDGRDESGERDDDSIDGTDSEEAIPDAEKTTPAAEEQGITRSTTDDDADGDDPETLEFEFDEAADPDAEDS